MLVNKTTLVNIFKAFKTTFLKRLENAPKSWQEIATLVNSTTSEENYAWLGDWPKLREWVGEKFIKNLGAFLYKIPNKDYESTVAIKRNDILDNQLGLYANRAEMEADAAGEWPEDLVFSALAGGFTGLCYDGQYFFDTDHPVGDGVVSNKGTKALSAATFAAASASYGAARTALMKMKNDEGTPLNIKPGLLVVPPALEAVALKIANSDKLDDNSPNPYKGTCRVLVSARLTSDTAWFLLDNTKPLKPIIFQQRQAPTPVEQTDPESDTVFHRKEFLFSVEARGNVGYGWWQTAYGSDGTT